MCPAIPPTARIIRATSPWSIWASIPHAPATTTGRATRNFRDVVVAVNGRATCLARQTYLDTLRIEKAHAAKAEADVPPGRNPHEGAMSRAGLCDEADPPARPARRARPTPVGRFKQYAHDQAVTVSLMPVEPGQRLSLQSHTGRAELWIVLDDGAAVQVGDMILSPGPATRSGSPPDRHRLGSAGRAYACWRLLSATGSRTTSRATRTITPSGGGRVAVEAAAPWRKTTQGWRPRGRRHRTRPVQHLPGFPVRPGRSVWASPPWPRASRGKRRVVLDGYGGVSGRTAGDWTPH